MKQRAITQPIEASARNKMLIFYVKSQMIVEAVKASNHVKVRCCKNFVGWLQFTNSRGSPLVLVFCSDPGP